MRFLFVVLFLSLLVLSGCSSSSVLVDDPDSLSAYFFFSQGCVSCDNLLVFLSSLEDEFDFFVVKSFDVSVSENKVLLDDLAFAYNDRVGGVPVVFVGDSVFMGFGGEASTGKLIRDKVLFCSSNPCKNPSDILLGVN